jgi:hypothetical protein
MEINKQPIYSIMTLLNRSFQCMHSSENSKLEPRNSENGESWEYSQPVALYKLKSESVLKTKNIFKIWVENFLENTLNV